MNITQVVGIDPGLVHTGLVSMFFNEAEQAIHVRHKAVVGTSAAEIKKWLDDLRPEPVVFIEAYRPRSHFGTDDQMVSAVSELRRSLPGSTVLDNTGVKKVVKPELMSLLGVWQFDTPTHHQDLRSAARIALLGMLRDKHMNQVVSRVVADHLKGATWDVVTY